MNKILGVNISSPDKVLYPKEGLTKLDVVKYYAKVAEFMLPFIKNHPLAVIRCHDNIENGFFKKHPTTEKDSVNTFFDGDEEYFYVKSKKDIIFQAQMGTIEFHTWGSKYPKIDQPSIMVFDLDPGEDISLERLREGVRDLKNVLTELRLEAFLKTSGGKGYHVVVPFKKARDWDTFSGFSKKVAELLEVQFPKKYTTNIRKNQRQGKIFVDYLRNTKGATCVAPFSLRARNGAPISVPIAWRDLDKVAPSQVTLKNITKKMLSSEAWAGFDLTGQFLR